MKLSNSLEGQYAIDPFIYFVKPQTGPYVLEDTRLTHAPCQRPLHPTARKSWGHYSTWDPAVTLEICMSYMIDAPPYRVVLRLPYLKGGSLRDIELSHTQSSLSLSSLSLFPCRQRRNFYSPIPFKTLQSQPPNLSNPQPSTIPQVHIRIYFHRFLSFSVTVSRFSSCIGHTCSSSRVSFPFSFLISFVPNKLGFCVWSEKLEQEPESRFNGGRGQCCRRTQRYSSDAIFSSFPQRVARCFGAIVS